MRLKEIIEEIELKGVLFIVLILFYMGIYFLFGKDSEEIIPFKLFFISTLILIPMSIGYLFRDPERDEADGVLRWGIAFSRGLCFIMFPLGPIIVIIMLMIKFILFLLR